MNIGAGVRAREEIIRSGQAARTRSVAGVAARTRDDLVFAGSDLTNGEVVRRAEVEFKKVLAVDPRFGRTLNYYGVHAGRILGNSLGRSGKMVKKARRQMRSTGAYLDSLGWVYYKQGTTRKPEATLRKAVARRMPDPTIHSPWVTVYAKTGAHGIARGAVGRNRLRSGSAYCRRI